MAVTNFAFAGGVAEVPGYGERWQIGFSDDWAIGDSWTLEVATAAFPFTLGMGVFNNLNPTVCFTFKNREYVGLSSRYVFSDNSDPTEFEEQAPGAGFEDYLTQFGTQDLVKAFAQMQGRLIILATKTVQIWTVDADPSLFNLVQTLENIGTEAPLSVRSIGDYDVIFLDRTGFRSLRPREVTLNAYVDDIGLAIDSLVQADLLTASASTCCSIVIPEGKRYWAYLNGKIYVLSRFTSDKITAWSTYLPVDSQGTTFTPIKFVVFNNQVYCRASDGGHILYGGADNNTYDATAPVFELPWLADGTPKLNKFAQGIDIGAEGGWKVYGGMYPSGGALTLIFTTPTPQGDAKKDSTFDLKHINFSQQGTHFKLKIVGDPTWTGPAHISTVLFHYNKAER